MKQLRSEHKRIFLLIFAFSLVAIGFQSNVFILQRHQRIDLDGGENLSSDSIPLETVEDEQPIIVTACNARFFSALENLVGSVHFWDPNTTYESESHSIASYFTILESATRRSKISRRGRTFNTKNSISDRILSISNRYRSSHGSRFSWRNNRSCKNTYCTNETIEFQLFRFWNGVAEAIGSIDEIPEERPLLDERKDFSDDSKGWDKLCTRIHSAMFEYYNFTKEEFPCEGRKMIEAGAIGIERDSPFVKKVLRNTALCALDRQCISPPGASSANHRFDQSAFSLNMAIHDFVVSQPNKTSEVDIRCCSHSKVPANETLETDIQLMFRRSLQPKPYTKYLKKISDLS